MKHSIKLLSKNIDFKQTIVSTISTFICASVLSISTLPISMPSAQAQNTLADFSVLPESLVGDIVANPNILIIVDNSGSMGRFTPRVGNGNIRDPENPLYIIDGETGTRYLNRVQTWDASSSMSNSYQVRQAMLNVLSNPQFTNRLNVGLMAFDTEDCTYDPADNNAFNGNTASAIFTSNLLYECLDANGNSIGAPVQRREFNRSTTGLGSLRANVANLAGAHRDTLLDLLALEPSPYINEPGEKNIGREELTDGTFVDTIILDEGVDINNPLNGVLHRFLDDSNGRTINGTEFPILSSPDNSHSNFTPLSGSLDSAFRYLLRNDTNVDDRPGLDTARFANGLDNREYSLVNSSIQYPTVDQCEGDFIVILLTDGLASQRAPGNLETGSGATGNRRGVAVNAAVESAERLRRRGAGDEADLAIDGSENPIELFVIGFNLSGNGLTGANRIANAGSGDGDDDRDAILAENPDEVEAALTAIFSEALNEGGSRSNLAVVAGADSALGSFVQPGFVPLMELDGADAVAADANDLPTSVSWTGQLANFFVDPFGNFREDTNSDGQLTTADAGFLINFDEGSELTHITRFDVADDGSVSNIVGVANPGNTADTAPASAFDVFIELADLNPIWSANDRLNALADDLTSIRQNRTYGALPGAAGGRHILTTIDGTNTIPFVWSNSENNPNSLDPSEVGLFDLPEANNGITGNLNPAAENLVNFIRGFEGNDNFRNRTLTGADNVAETYLLGDIVHSTPVQVEAPVVSPTTANSAEVAASFRPFAERYIDRRRMVYVGANDGMLHAFNGGFWDGLDADDAQPGTVSVTTSPVTGTATNFELGQEIWAYVPRAVFPHLKFLTDTNYLADTHVAYVDGSNRAYDAKLFDNTPGNCEVGTADDATAAASCGAPYTGDLDNDPDTDDATTATSYLVFDVTDPELPPVLISEISNADFNLGTVEPALVRTSVVLGTGTTSPTIEYALAFGSGPKELKTATITDSSAAELFVYELTDRDVTLDDTSNINNALVNTFVGGISSADWNGDDIDDAIYFGTIGGTIDEPDGQLYRGELSDTNNLSIQLLVNANGAVELAPVIPADQLTVANKYILFGTGRNLVPDDLRASYTAPNLFAGIIEDIDTLNSSEVTFGTGTIADDLNASNILPTDVSTNTNSSLVDEVVDVVALDGLTRSELLTTFGNSSADRYQGWFFELPLDSARMSAAPFTVEELGFFTDFEPQSIDELRAAAQNATPAGESPPLICLPGGTGFLTVFDYRIGIVPAQERFLLSEDVLLPIEDRRPTDAPNRLAVSNSLLAGGVALLTAEDANGNQGIRIKLPGGDQDVKELAGTLIGPPDGFGRSAWREIRIPDSETINP